MKTMVQLTSNEINALQYQVVVEMWDRINRSHHKHQYQLYAATFDEAERKKIKQWYTLFHRWYLGSRNFEAHVGGVPADGVVMSPRTLIWLQNKVIPFFGQL
jgi:hypothetical protein